MQDNSRPDLARTSRSTGGEIKENVQKILGMILRIAFIGLKYLSFRFFEEQSST